MGINNACDLYYPYEWVKFVHNIEGSEWAFQKFKNRIKCLVCSGEENGEFFRSIFNEEDLEGHIKDTNHDENRGSMFYYTIDDEVGSYLDVYHYFWNKFSLPLRMHQIYFSPRDEKTTCCDLCEIYLTYNETNIQTHIFGYTHQSNLSEDGPVPWSRRTVQAPKIYYPFDLLVDVMGITGKNMSLNIQMLDQNYFYCLVCQININGDCNQLEDHLKSDHHIDQIDNESRNLYVYHFEWLRMDDQFQYKQVFFTPCSDNTAHCKICQRELNYLGLYDHTNCYTHKNEIRKMEVYGKLSRF